MRTTSIGGLILAGAVAAATVVVAPSTVSSFYESALGSSPKAVGAWSARSPHNPSARSPAAALSTDGAVPYRGKPTKHADRRNRPTTSPTPTTSAVVTAPPAETTTGSPVNPLPETTSLSVLDFGARGDGVADDTAALQSAFDAAQPGQTVLVPAGKTFTQSGELRIRTPGVTVAGGGTLLATQEARSSLVLAADGVVLQDVTLAISQTTKRWSAAEQQRLRVYGHTGIVVRNVRVQGSAAAGVFVHGGASHFLLDAVQVSGTRADGIHMTDGVHDGQVVRPVVRDVGDDGVAVVSYAGDGVRCARITVTSPVVDGVSAGRGVTVVGGTDITYRDIDVRDTSAAGVYIAAEGSWNTLGVSNVRVLGGSVSGVNTSRTTDHGAVLVFNGTASQVVRDVEISGLDVSGVPTTVSRWVGAIADASAPVGNVVLSGLALNGPGPGTTFVSAPHVTYQVAGWTRDGKPLAP